MKKIIAIVLSLVMLCMVFGCAEKQETAQNGAVNLKIYQLGTRPDDWAEVEAKFNEYTLKDLGVTTTWEFIPSGSFSEKMNGEGRAQIWYEVDKSATQTGFDHVITLSC